MNVSKADRQPHKRTNLLHTLNTPRALAILFHFRTSVTLLLVFMIGYLHVHCVEHLPYRKSGIEFEGAEMPGKDLARNSKW